MAKLVLGLPGAQELPGPIQKTLRQFAASIQAWAGRVEGVGKWVGVPYSTSHFSSDVGGWTCPEGGYALYGYRIVGDSMQVAFRFLRTTITGTPAQLWLRLPNGYRATSRHYTGPLQSEGTINAVGCTVSMDAAQTAFISLRRVPTANWSNSAGAQDVRGMIELQVVK